MRRAAALFEGGARARISVCMERKSAKSLLFPCPINIVDNFIFKTGELGAEKSYLCRSKTKKVLPV